MSTAIAAAALLAAVIMLSFLIPLAQRVTALESAYGGILRELSNSEDFAKSVSKSSQSRDDTMAARLDALERRPPVVTVTLQPPAPAPKQGKAVAK